MGKKNIDYDKLLKDIELFKNYIIAKKEGIEDFNISDDSLLNIKNISNLFIKNNKTPKIWIISDTHFNHDNIINKFEFRPQNYNEQITRKIKNNVGPNDILIHLGDVIFDKPSELGNFLKKMGTCKKILVRGNHDKNGIDFYMNKGFDFVCDELILKNFLGVNIIFSHIPKKDGELKEGFINIHGHLHTNSHHLSEYTKNPERYILYSAEKENFMPIYLNNLIKNYKEKTPKEYWDFKL